MSFSMSNNGQMIAGQKGRPGVWPRFFFVSLILAQQMENKGDIK